MTVKKSDLDMLVRRDAEGRQEFVAWGARAEVSRAFESADGLTIFFHDADHAVIPRDRIEVTDDVTDLGPGWRARYECDGMVTETTISACGMLFHPDDQLLSAWRIVDDTPSEVEALITQLRADAHVPGVAPATALLAAETIERLSAGAAEGSGR